MKYEKAIKSVGGCGRYQNIIINLVFIGIVFDSAHIGSNVFIVPTIKHRCAIPDLTNDTYEVQNEDHAKLIKEYIHEEMVDGKPVYSKCHLYVNKSLLRNQQLSKCNSWVYDKSTFQTTISSDFNLVCGKEWLTQQIYSVCFAGDLFAVLTWGWLSDRFGRKTVIVAALMLQGVAGILSTQMMNINAILMLRFLIYVGGSGCFVSSVVYGTEISSMENRTSSSVAVHVYFTFGFIILSFLTYYIRNWKLLVLLISIPPIPLALLYICVLHESPRWLLTMKKKKEFEKVLKKMAEINGCDFSYKSEEIEISRDGDRTVKLWKIFTIPTLLKRTLILIFNWVAVSLVYYGLLINTENLSGNIFLNFFFGALVEIPSYILCNVLLNRIGRKKLYIAFMLTGGICGILTILPMIYASNDLQWTATVLATISRLCFAGVFTIIYIHTTELYPTCVRNGALGFLSTFAGVGGSIAPYLMMMRFHASGRFGSSLPLLVMGLISLVGSALYAFLPETSNRPILDTFEDVCKPNFELIRENDEYKMEAKTALIPST